MTIVADFDPKILMTLAGLAYGDPSAIPGYLATDTLTAGDLEIFWVPNTPDAPDNFAFIARSRSTKLYFVAIRGTYPNPLSPAYWNDSAQDNPIGYMELWDGAEAIGARVSSGTWRGIWNVRHLPGASGSLENVLLGVEQGATVRICGHSLGGTLTPVLALWLKERRADLDIAGAAFAGMSPGNAAFASLFGPGKPLHGRIVRWNNTLDTVGYGWDRILQTLGFYSPHPKSGWLVSLFQIGIAARLWSYRFTSIGTEVKLSGALRKPVVDTEIIAYVIETLYQHLPSTYVALLGAPPLPFDIGFGSVVLERDPASPGVPHLLSRDAPQTKVRPYFIPNPPR